MKKGSNKKHMLRRDPIVVLIMACAFLFFGNDTTLAREDKPRKSPDGIVQSSPSSDEEEPIEGYPVRKRYVGGPTDVEWDLDNSFPKQGSVLEMILRCLDNEDR
jgi:hypothetical protein